MSNNKNLKDILSENQKLKLEITKKMVRNNKKN